MLIVWHLVRSGNALNFTWNKDDARFDCVVGISIDGDAAGTGVFIAPDTILTSANVVEDHVDSPGAITVFMVDTTHDAHKSRSVECIVSVFGKGIDRKKAGGIYWLQHGSTKDNSPLHDLYSLGLTPDAKDNVSPGSGKYFVIANPIKGYYNRNINERHPFMAKAVFNFSYIATNDFMWAGFNYLSKTHMKERDFLEMEIYGQEEVYIDCDEWIPREWGRFICIENYNNNPGVASGAPLFSKGLLVGIGSFMLVKNNASIHVFTDLRDYTEEMVVCANYAHIEFNESIKDQKFNPLDMRVIPYNLLETKITQFVRRLNY